MDCYIFILFFARFGLSGLLLHSLVMVCISFTKIIATYLAKFINGLQSKIIINIQNTGGTVVIFNGWYIDNNIYKMSKAEPFFVIDTGKRLTT